MTIFWQFEKSSPRVVATGESDKLAGARGTVTKYNSGAETISLEDVSATVSYDPETGAFFAKKGWKKGLKVGSRTKAGYIKLSIRRRSVLAHRVAWLLVHGRWPSALIDHADHNPANNAISNLREATVSQNAQNARNKGYTRQSKGRGFLARIKVGDKVLCLGTYPTEREARDAYMSASLQHFREFSAFNNGEHQ